MSGTGQRCEFPSGRVVGVRVGTNFYCVDCRCSWATVACNSLPATSRKTEVRDERVIYPLLPSRCVASCTTPPITHAMLRVHSKPCEVRKCRHNNSHQPQCFRSQAKQRRLRAALRAKRHAGSRRAHELRSHGVTAFHPLWSSQGRDRHSNENVLPPVSRARVVRRVAHTQKP